MNTCLHCGQATANLKYCSRSCAATVNGRLYPSRKPIERSCKHCGTALLSRRTTCDQCNPAMVDWGAVSLHTLKMKALQQYAAQVRSLARTAYRKSDKPQQCVVCSYDKHYEVCHIKPIREFEPADSVAKVNELSNLVALCPNHHWEFDHSMLSLAAITSMAASIESVD